MSKLKTCSTLIATIFTLTACQTTAEADANRPGTGSISLREVTILADSICGSTRPNFAGAQARMVRDGLTVVQNGRNFSPTQDVSAAVSKTPNGRTLCAVRSTFAGNEFTLDKAMEAEFGPAKQTNQITPPSRYYNLGAKGNLVLIIRATPGRTVTTYDLGYVQGF